MIDAERLARLAERAADEVTDGMIVGLGSGSTAEAVIRALARRIASGLRITGVPTSARTERLARELQRAGWPRARARSLCTSSTLTGATADARWLATGQPPLYALPRDASRPERAT